MAVRVADDASPPAGASARFEITVTGRQSSLVIQRPAKHLELRLSTFPFLYIVPDAAESGWRYFRLHMAQ